MAEEQHYCRECGVPLTVGENWWKSQKEQYHYICKDCHRKNVKKWKQENPEKDREHKRRWQQENPEKVRENQRRWQQENPEKVREHVRKYHREHREERKEYFKKYYEENREKHLAIAKLNNAIERGELERAPRCECCYKECKTVGHHENYNKELQVVWLCKSCHKRRHSEYYPEVTKDVKRIYQRKHGDLPVEE